MNPKIPPEAPTDKIKEKINNAYKYDNYTIFTTKKNIYVLDINYNQILKEDIIANIDPTLFVLDAEKALYNAVSAISFNGNYAEHLKNLININDTVTKFFDDVLVMDKDEKIKNNRLALLNELKNKYIILTDFSKLNV